jgi:hypothetical protein
MPNRQQQADRVTAALADWVNKSVAFDNAHAADMAAMQASNDAFRAFNAVSDRLAEGARGYTDEQIIEARQLKIKREKARKVYDDAFLVTAAASTARNDARATLLNAVTALDQTGEQENMGGTIL